MLKTNIENIERMMIHANVTQKGIEVYFADGCNGLIPFKDIPEIKDTSNISNIELPNPYLVNIYSSDNILTELPWDFVRHYCDTRYKPRIETIAQQGRMVLGKKIRTLREHANMTQAELAKVAGIGRITEVRIEKGDRSPRYETLGAIAKALNCTLADLVSNSCTIEDDTTDKKKSDNSDDINMIVSQKEADLGENKSIIFKTKSIVQRALESALINDWKTSIRLLKEAKIIMPNEYYAYIENEVEMVWFCIQKTAIGPLISRAEKALSVWEYQLADELLADISSILEIAEFPLNYEDYSHKIVNIAGTACGAADRWRNSHENKLERLVTGVGIVKANTEELIDKMVENKSLRYR